MEEDSVREGEAWSWDLREHTGATTAGVEGKVRIKRLRCLHEMSSSQQISGAEIISSE